MLSHPIAVPNGNMRAGLDLFTDVGAGGSLGSHIRSQLLQLTQVAPPTKTILFSVFVQKELEEMLIDSSWLQLAISSGRLDIRLLERFSSGN